MVSTQAIGAARQQQAVLAQLLVTPTVPFGMPWTTLVLGLIIVEW